MGSVSKKSDMEALAQLRTLMALERNFLSKARTALSEFRTGLALVLLGPPLSAGISLFLSSLTTIDNLILNIVNFTLFGVVFILGLYIAIKSRIAFNKIREKQKSVLQRQREIINRHPDIDSLIGEFIEPDEIEDIL
ncbi:MAG: hypothetical protein ACTSQY_01725 [Candidatus Odinarchaeia archaeon]